MKLSKLKLNSSWTKFLKQEFNKEYMKELEVFLNHQIKAGKTIYPKEENIFAALNATPLDKVKVVILGQDPYHGENQAHGLSFSVNKGVKIPPSLRNIYQELHDDLSIPIANHGNLENWAKGGVLLLNNVLTVEKANAGSHQKKGWEIFTDKIIKVINEQRSDIVFLLWGAPAQKKAKKVDSKKHFILTSPHPSPLSSYRGWFGSKHFSKCNTYLKSKGMPEVDWSTN
ncbi:uracil-DNA glycosylase [Halobacteriovorax sp. HLS]|uniref:uracil-DNA glycosylase n=1 Tax=Halobacteriovorax sp. HLS TaxID=2234000 RepID=UPI000FD73364|nr:uracil-DNA glycosylase [Halobacteriovorax sp. HLS]